MSIKAQAVQVLHFAFNGAAGDGTHAGGTVSIPGLQVGDIYQLYNSDWTLVPVGSGGYGNFGGSSTYPPPSGFNTATVADQLYQYSTQDLSAVTFHLIVFRLAA